ERGHIRQRRDSLELRAAVAQLDEPDWSNGRAAPSAPTGAFLALTATGASTTATTKPETRPGHRNHRHTLALDRCSKDSRNLRTPPARLPDPLKQLAPQPRPL